VLCVLDRDGGGREALADAGVSLHALLDVHDLNEAFDAGVGIEEPA
jgi:orotate phosphoribosyltransferase